VAVAALNRAGKGPWHASLAWGRVLGADSAARSVLIGYNRRMGMTSGPRVSAAAGGGCVTRAALGRERSWAVAYCDAKATECKSRGRTGELQTTG
jgi:hypothetical protein